MKLLWSGFHVCMAEDGRKSNIAIRANAWQQRADKEYEKQPVLAFSGRHYQHLGQHEVLTFLRMYKNT